MDTSAHLPQSLVSPVSPRLVRDGGWLRHRWHLWWLPEPGRVVPGTSAVSRAFNFRGLRLTDFESPATRQFRTETPHSPVLARAIWPSDFPSTLIEGSALPRPTSSMEVFSSRHIDKAGWKSRVWKPYDLGLTCLAFSCVLRCREYRRSWSVKACGCFPQQALIYTVLELVGGVAAAGIFKFTHEAQDAEVQRSTLGDRPVTLSSIHFAPQSPRQQTFVSCMCFQLFCEFGSSIRPVSSDPPDLEPWLCVQPSLHLSRPWQLPRSMPSLRLARQDS